MWDLQRASLRMRDRRTRKYILIGGGALLSAYIAYRASRSETVSNGKQYLNRLRLALQKYTDALATGGEVCSSVLRDLQEFLQSEDNEIPSSLRQLTKLIQSPEIVATTSSTVAAVYNGIAGPQPESAAIVDPSQQRGALDKVLDAVLSDRGHSLVSVAVSMAAKNMVSSYLETSHRLENQDGERDINSPSQQEGSSTDKMYTFLSSPQGQQLAVMCVAAFASNGMRVYMDKSLEVNLYEDLFASMSKPQHLEAVKQCVSIFARDIVGSYMQGGSAPSNSALSNLPQAPRFTPLDTTEVGEDEEERNEDQDAAIAHAPPTSFGSIEEVLPSPLAAEPSHSGAASILEEGGPSGSSTTSTTPDRLVQIDVLPHHRTAAWTHLMTHHDDLDSDSLLHASRASGSEGKQRTLVASGGSRAKQLQFQSNSAPASKNKSSNSMEAAPKTAAVSSSDHSQAGWVSVVGKEWLNAMKDPTGREAMLGIVSSATKEVVQGVTSAAAERINFDTTWFVVVLLLGALSAWLFQMMMKATAAVLLS